MKPGGVSPSSDGTSPKPQIVRGPLRAIVLAATGQDIRRCTGCSICEHWVTPGMDLTFGDLMQAAARDDPIALTNQTLWHCDEFLETPLRCQAGIDIVSVVLALQREADRRGLAPSPAL